MESASSPKGWSRKAMVVTSSLFDKMHFKYIFKVKI